MSLYGVKKNKCILDGVQGIVKVDESTASQSGLVLHVNNPSNNTLYVAKGYSKVSFGNIPENPPIDYNFSITYNNPTGFSGTFAGNFLLSYGGPDDPYNPIGIKLDNPDFDLTDNYTTIHLHVWYDGINYCGKIDGYV